jgi:lincosamide nucleotidyltransferase A/C/D/E
MTLAHSRNVRWAGRVVGRWGTLDAQLQVLVDIIEITDREGIAVWFVGGYGIDALEGRITRPHGDIDIMAQDTDLDRLHAAAIANGFRVDDYTPPHHVMASKDGVHVDCIVWRRLGDGRLAIDTGEKGVFAMPGEALCDEPNGVLCGLPVRSGGYELIYCLKAGFRAYAPESELRDKDRHDLEILCRRIPAARREELHGYFVPLARDEDV